MKLIEHTNTIEKIGNVSHENTFRMKSSRKAFQILSDLYSNKSLAIVRELGCNAADSHKMAGQTKPFHIHLPNSLEPWLTIQDFGTGISDKDVNNIYCVYFESTKTESNDQIGCLGLGSKSPFCYSDTFMVTSITGGVKRVYNAYFNEQSTPAISKVSESPTTEASGLAIQIPVKPTDFNDFIVAVKTAFRFFDVKPTISGGSVDWSMETPIFQGKGWKSYDKFGYHECYAIMGGVTYPIDCNKIDKENQQMAYKGGLVINFEMGELEFTPSRESLSYHPYTIKALNDKFEFIKKDFVEGIGKMLNDKTNIFDAIKAIWVLQNKYAHINGLTLDKEVLWRGINIANPIDLINKTIKKGLVASETNPVITYHKTGWYKHRVNESSVPSLETECKWMYDDESIKHPVVRIKEWCRNNESKKITFFSKLSYANLLKAGFPASIFESVSTLPTPPKKPRKARGANTNVTQRTKGAFVVYEMGDVNKKMWESVEIDPSDAEVSYPKYYIQKDSTFNFGLDIPGLKNRIESKEGLHKIMKFLEISKDDIVLVAEQNIKRIPGVINFVEYVKTNVDLSFDKDDMATCFNYSHTAVNAIANRKDFAALPDNNEFKKAIKKIHACITKYSKFQHMRYEMKANTDNGKMWKSNNDLIKVLLSKVGSYMWEVETIMLIVKNLK